MERCRQSGIEVLRIMSMIFIMLGHTHLRIHQLPIASTIINHPISSFWNILLSCVTATGVPIFIAISGWFGINFKKQGITNYLFLVFFTLWSIYGIAIALHIADFNFIGVKVSMGFYEGYWFVAGYLGLYIISPILNSFIENATKKEVQIVLLSYYLFQGYYSWISGWYNYYDGYSVILFAGIYLTTSYIRKYPVNWVEKKHRLLLFIIILLMTLIVYLFLWSFGFAGRQIRDDNPLVIFAAILLVIIFSKLKFNSKVVNWLAASCFTVYLIHYNPLIYPHLMSFMHYIYAHFDGFTYGIVLIVTLLLVYVTCTLYDQFRILCWNLFIKK